MIEHKVHENTKSGKLREVSNVANRPKLITSCQCGSRIMYCYVREIVNCNKCGQD